MWKIFFDATIGFFRSLRVHFRQAAVWVGLRRRRRVIFASIIGAVFMSGALWTTLVSPPSAFPLNERVHIEIGSSISEVGELLLKQDVIRSAAIFKILGTIFGGAHGVIAGDYVFHEPRNLFSIWRAFSQGNYGVQLERVTIPEGTSVSQIAKRLDTVLINFDVATFIVKAKPFEGYLFPDTYFWYENATPDLVLTTMRNNFQLQLTKVAADIAAFGRPLEDVITMASLIEEEARTEETRRTIAGILWKRLDKGMPLQVDAVFQYLIGKGSSELTVDDLALNSPYNTYTHKGLPPGPITNPGLEAIRDTVTPIATPYYFYLSDKNGTMHYATTFEQHKRNIARYLPLLFIS